MNCIIVDDDKLSCKVIAELVRKSSFLTLAGEYSSAVDARNDLMNRSDIDLVFLDIEMPMMDGFDFIGSLESPPSIIMVTGTEDHAVKAYDFDVIDYLIKPVAYSRFCKALNKVIKYQGKTIGDNLGSQEIFIKKGSSLVKIRLDDIVLIEALENYVVLHTQTEKYTIHFTMKAIVEQLPSYLFIRVHRSYIVNKSRINSIRDNTLEIYDYTDIGSVPIGKSYRDALLKEINVMLR